MEGPNSNTFRVFHTIHEGWEKGWSDNIHKFKRHRRKGITLENANGKIFISNENLPRYVEVLNKILEEVTSFKNRI